MRRNPSTVVVLAGQAPEALLAAVGRSMNVSVVWPPEEPGPGSGFGSGSGSGGSRDRLEAAAEVLRRAAGISSPYVLVAADPLASVAAEWQAMWEVSAGSRGSEAFELRAAEALAAWRGNRFELPDYYMVLVPAAGPPQQDGKAAGTADTDEQRPDFYLGPLRSVRPNRVAVVAAAEPAEQSASLLRPSPG